MHTAVEEPILRGGAGVRLPPPENRVNVESTAIPSSRAHPWPALGLFAARRPASVAAVASGHAILGLSIIGVTFWRVLVDFSVIDHGHLFHAGWLLSQGGGHGSSYLTPCPPGLYLLCRFAIDLLGARFDAPVYMSLLLGLAAAALGFEFARRSRLATWASLLLALLAAAGTHLVWGYLWYDTLGGFALFLALVAIAWPGRVRNWPLALGGAAVALALATKPNIGLIALALALAAAAGWPVGRRSARLAYFLAGFGIAFPGIFFLAGTDPASALGDPSLGLAARHRLFVDLFALDMLGKTYRDLPSLFALFVPAILALLAAERARATTWRQALGSRDLLLGCALLLGLGMMHLTSSGPSILHLTLATTSIIFLLRWATAGGGEEEIGAVRDDAARNGLDRRLGVVEGALAVLLFGGLLHVADQVLYRRAFASEPLHARVEERVEVGGAFGRFRCAAGAVDAMRGIVDWLAERRSAGARILMLPHHNYLGALAGVEIPCCLLWYNYYSFNARTIDRALAPLRDPELDWVLLRDTTAGETLRYGRPWLEANPAIRDLLLERFLEVEAVHGFLVFQRRPRAGAGSLGASAALGE